jgi:hypothetical protein
MRLKYSIQLIGKHETMKNQDIAPSSEYRLQQSEIMNATSEFREGAFAFVTDGTVAVRELGHYGVTEPIPRGECAISALVAGKGRGKIYGATTGTNAHLFYYDPSPIADHVVDIGVLGHGLDCRQLFLDKEGVLCGIANPTGKIFRYDPRGEYSLIWTYYTNDIQWLEGDLNGEVAAATIDDLSGKIFGVRKRDSRLFAYDPKSQEVHDLATVDGAGNGNAIAMDGRGVLYGSGKNGRLFRYCGQTDCAEVLDIQIPSPRGMEYLNHVDSLVFDGVTTIYGGTTLGCLFRFNTATLEVTSCGRVLTDHRIRALVIGDDGVLHGCAGSPGKNSHLFRWNPKIGEIKDLGLPMVHFPKNWICYDISSLTVGRNGEIYLGESERTSYLFIYYPPVAKRQL